MAENRIRVIVDPDTTGFQSELTADLKKVHAEVNVPVDIDTTAAKVQIKQFSSTTGKTPIDIPVTTDTTRARTILKQFTQSANTPINKTLHLSTVGAQRSLTALGKFSTGVFKSIGRNAARGLAGATALLGVAAFSGKDELIEAEKVSARTAGLIKAQGKSATVTQKQVEDLSEALLKKTGVDDQLIQSTANQILGNSNLARSLATNENFLKQATTAALGMSAVTGKDLPNSTKVLTRALNDPTKAISALQRAGITLSKQQREEIQALADSGHAHEARARIIQAVTQKTSAALDEQGKTNAARIGRLQEQFSGFAAGILEKLLPVFDIIQTQGGKLLKALSPLGRAFKTIGSIVGSVFARQLGGSAGIFEMINKAATSFADTLEKNRPSIERFIESFVKFVKDVGPAAVDILGSMYDAAKPLLKVIIDVGGKFADLTGDLIKFISSSEEAKAVLVGLGTAVVIIKTITAATKAWAIAQTALNLILTANPIGIVVVAIGALVAGLIYAYKHSERFRAIVDTVLNFVKDNWQKIALFFVAPIALAVKFLMKHWGTIKSGAKKMLDFLYTWFVKIPMKILSSIKAFGIKLWNSIKSAWDKVKSVTVAAVNAYINFVRTFPGKVLNAIKSIITHLINTAKNAWEGFRRMTVSKVMAIIAFYRAVPGRIIAAFGRLANMLKSKGKEVFNGFLDGIKAGWEKVKDWLGKVKDWIVDLKGPPEVDASILYDNGRLVMDGFKRGLEDKWTDVKGLLKEKTGDLKNWLHPWDTIKDIQRLVAGVFNGNVDISDISKKLDEEGTNGLHPVTGAADLKKQAALMEKLYNLSVSSMYRAYDTVAGPGVSQHTLWQAVDFVGGGLSHWIEVAKKLSHLVGKVFKQIITNNQLYPGGGYVGNHMDHIHFGWIPGKRYGGRMMAGHPYRVGESGEELMVPDTNGFMMSNRDLNRMFSYMETDQRLRRSPGAAVGGNAPQINIEMNHNVPDANSLAAVLGWKLQSIARNTLPNFAGGIA